MSELTGNSSNSSFQAHLYPRPDEVVSYMPKDAAEVVPRDIDEMPEGVEVYAPNAVAVAADTDLDTRPAAQPARTEASPPAKPSVFTAPEQNIANPSSSEFAPQHPGYAGKDGRQYAVYPVEDFYNGEHGIRETIVVDETGEKFYIAHKNPEVQAFAYSIGEFVAQQDLALSRFQFPRVRAEELEDKTVSLVEYFEGYDELRKGDPDHILTDEERAFIGVYNLFVGNRDIKGEHTLISSAGETKIALIDLDVAFQTHEITEGDYASRLKDLGPMASPVADIQIYCRRGLA